MKQLHLPFLLLCVFLFQGITTPAQVNLPATLTFTSDNPSNWNDGVAEDGEGGSADINGLNLQVYTVDADHTTLFPGSTIIWHDNTYYASTAPGYTGITSGPDLAATINGVPAMVIKSADDAVNFSLQSIQLYDWGYTDVITIETYDDGAIVGSVDFTPDAGYNPLTVSQADLLTPAVFNHIDEIRFFPKAPNTIFNLSMNNISLDVAAGVLPVTFSSINARQQNKNIDIEWKVAYESGIRKYEVERSADGQAFQSVATQTAGGSGTETTYHWLDENAIQGNNFYRIKTTDINGKVAYSPTIKIYSGHTRPALVIYPNPAPSGMVYLQMNDLPAGTYYAKLFNNAGKTLLVKTITHAGGNSNETLNFSNLPKGIYLLEVSHPDHSKLKSTIVY